MGRDDESKRVHKKRETLQKTPDTSPTVTTIKYTCPKCTKNFLWPQLAQVLKYCPTCGKKINPKKLSLT